ncbi:MAG: IS110 family transposase [Candidatus Thiodiazotropha weberae]|nr:IS110 family transposase [Candidatus Thiodiazotropha lotti]MCG8011357.1 IS110 family transposase [Candidatus Thiodiazotropha lotti]MCW4210820.1 IS110 family transposase [Candidatus Thiodiazotropha lotti]MCW4216942.1 IS110 family transposase [Candidatus Thiodiazotropha lotti]
MKKHSLIAIDLAKNNFQVCVLDPHNKVTLNMRLKRSQLAELIAQQKPGPVAMEACYSSHYWARLFSEMGHDVKLIPALHVKPFVRGNKNDHNDALAIAEASQRPNIKFVPIKTIDQQDIQALHRIRERIVGQRTGLINQTRGILSEYGIITQKGIKHFSTLLAALSQPEAREFTGLMKDQLQLIAQEYRVLTDRLNKLNRQLKDIAAINPLCQILMTLPGIGYINATALVSAVGNGSQFTHAREMSVWLGVTPKLHASGDTGYLSGISKRGNRYLRRMMIHGARAALYRCKNPHDSMILWAREIAKRSNANKAAVALANRLTRLAWILLQKQEPYQVTR